MKISLLYTASLILALPFSLLSQIDQLPIYKDTTKTADERALDLVNKMTLDEKIFLLTSASDTNKMVGRTPGWMGFVHNAQTAGVAAEKYNLLAKYMKTQTKYGLVSMKTAEGIFAYMGNGSTAFPQPLAQASSWEPQLVAKVADVLSKEIKSRGVRLLFSPVLNIGRDPRWGRTGETYGEDPYLVSRMGLAYVKTMESKGLATTLKHFAGNTGHDGKFGASVFYSERYYREYEFLPYETAIKEGGAQAIMMAYNTGDAIPFAQNNWMMNTYLKGELGFKGVIMSDGGGLRLIDEAFGLDTNDIAIVSKCINAGCDWALDEPKYYYKALKEAHKLGLVKESTITESAKRTLRIMFKTGVYDNPYVDAQYADSINDCEEHRKIALELANKTIVLLKNEKNTLPFSKNIKNVLVTGQLGNKLLVNHYAGWGRKEVTVLEGITKLLPKAKVNYKMGAHVGYAYFPAIDFTRFSHNLNGKQQKGLKAEYFNNSDLLGNPILVKSDSTIDFDWRDGAPFGLELDNFSVRWSGKIKVLSSGTYEFGANADDGLTIYINDKLLIDMRSGPSNAIFVEKAKMYLEKGVEYNIRAEYKEKGGKAYVHLGWNENTMINIPAAIQEAQKADAIVAVVGMYDDENGDRAILNLDEAQEQLLIELSKLGKPMAVVIQTGNVITMRRWADKVPAILQAWYPGEEGGNAIAATLFGDSNPSAKLPITIPLETGQVPLTYNRFPGKDTRPVDRGLDKFFDVGNEPMFCFGHGLSYTSFEYSNIKLSSNTISETDSLVISVDVRNTGKRVGQEIVQLYIHDVLASVSRPIMELKSFAKTSLQPNETKTLRLTLKSEQLKFYDANMKKIFEPGDIELMIGASSKDIRWTGMIKAVR